MNIDKNTLRQILETANVRSPTNIKCTEPNKKKLNEYFKQSMVLWQLFSGIRPSTDCINIAASCDGNLIVISMGKISRIENKVITLKMDFSLGQEGNVSYNPHLRDCLRKSSWIYEEYVRFKYNANIIQIDYICDEYFLEHYKQYGYVKTKGGHTLYEKNLESLQGSNLN